MSSATQVQNRPQQQQMSPAVQWRERLVNDRDFVRGIESALPAHITKEKFLRMMLTTMAESPDLYKCNPQSVLLAAISAASMGLVFGKVHGEAYPIPFGNECVLVPGYRGLIKLARQSGKVADVWAEVVYEDDEFSYELGLNPTLEHQRNDDTEAPGKLKYAYAVARLDDGERKFVVLNRREIAKIRNFSKASRKGPWVDWEEEMWKKSAVRRLCKMLPLSPELDEAIELDNVAARKLGIDEATAPATGVAGLESKLNLANGPATEFEGEGGELFKSEADRDAAAADAKRERQPGEEG